MTDRTRRAQEILVAALREAGYAAEPDRESDAIWTPTDVPCEIVHRASMLARKGVGADVLSFGDWHEYNQRRTAELGMPRACTCGHDG